MRFYPARFFSSLLVFGPKVAGFRYFSSQGRNPGGFGNRWAFFEGVCPILAAGKMPDCGVICSDKPELFCCGHMIAPQHWPDATAIQTAIIRDMTKQRGLTEATPDFIEELNRENPAPTFSSNFDGITTDDSAEI